MHYRQTNQLTRYMYLELISDLPTRILLTPHTAKSWLKEKMLQDGALYPDQSTKLHQRLPYGFAFLHLLIL